LILKKNVKMSFLKETKVIYDDIDEGIVNNNNLPQKIEVNISNLRVMVAYSFAMPLLFLLWILN